MSMKLVKTKKFKANLVREYASVPRVDELGQADNEMKLYLDAEHANCARKGFIEWNFELANHDQDGIEIGLVFDDGALTDYDGVFSLCEEAIQMLRDFGFIVGKEFEA